MVRKHIADNIDACLIDLVIDWGAGGVLTCDKLQGQVEIYISTSYGSVGDAAAQVEDAGCKVEVINSFLTSSLKFLLP